MNKERVFSKSEFEKKLEKEQELLDFLMAMLRGKNIKTDRTGNILTDHGLRWESVTDDEMSMLKDMMSESRGRYLRAWKVSCDQTEKRFNDFCEKKDLTLENGGITRLFHGSGTPNWWSIITNGLYLNPSGVTIHGKMFGYGLYFAPRAQKSIGYTSSYGSYWAHGDCSKGYLAVFKVATGNIYDVYADPDRYIPNNWTDFHENRPDKDCLWAYGRSTNGASTLMNDEVIVYQECQATIEYLIEFSA